MTDKMKWYGSPDLQPLLVPIDSVSRYPGNPRHGDVGALCKSFERFGQTKPIAVQLSTGHIVAGNHAWDAMKALRWTHVAVARNALTDRDAKAYLIADNRTEELGTYDFQTLGSLLTELAQDDNLDGTGYDGDDVDALLASLEGSVTEHGGHGGRGRSKANACMVCGSVVAERFQLKLQWVEDRVEYSRGAGSVALCEEDWQAHARSNMARPRQDFAELKATVEEEVEE